MSLALATILGVSEVTGAILTTSAKLAVGARQVDDGAAQKMVDRMKGRVAQDSGRLYNGINWTRISETTIEVRASAQNPLGRGGAAGADYASFVENGTDNMEAQPFFQISVDEVLPERELEMRRIVDGLAA